MKADFCKSGCGEHPSCAVSPIITAVTVENIIEGCRNKKIYLTCPINALNIENGSLTKKSGCTECGLCEIACIHSEYSGDIISPALEKMLLTDLARLNIFFTHVFYNFDTVIASEVKAKGNSREKRIDIVAVSENKIFFIKVLKDINKLPVYSRSYDELCDYYAEKFPKYSFEKIIIAPSDKAEAAKARHYDCTDLCGSIIKIRST